jgi:Zn-dependent metalloprotease
MSSHALLFRATVPLMIAGLCALLAGLRVAAAASDPNIIPQQMTVTQIEAAQRVPNLRAMHVDKSGIPSHIHGDLGSFRTEVSTPEAETAAFVGRMRDLLRADGSETFKLRRLTREASRGAQHYRMKQLINGLEVIGGEVIVHVDQTTSRIVSNRCAVPAWHRTA